MTWRVRAGLLAAAGLAVLALLVGVGRREGRKHADAENRGIARLARVVGPLDGPSLDAYRVLGVFDCLLYRRGTNPYALELCIDPSGRVIEAIDRRGSTPRIWSLREEPSAATLHVDRAKVTRLIRRLAAMP